MEFLHENYLINYSSNTDDFRINIYNQLNNKKYELIESILVTKYKEIGIDLFEIITDCFGDNEFELIDNDNIIVIKINYQEIIKLSLNIPNILCEYKDATILDLKTQIMKQNIIIKNLQDKITILDTKTKILDTKIDIGDNVKIPRNIKNVVICGHIDSSGYNYQNIFPFTIQLYNLNLANAGVNYFNSAYYGYKKPNKNNCHYLKPSANEFYQDIDTPFICFKNTIDFMNIGNKFSNIEKLGLFNIKIKNFQKLAYIKNLYLNNVEILDVDGCDLTPFINLETLGINNCKNIDLQGIKHLSMKNKLKEIYINNSNIKKEDLPTRLKVLD